MSLKITNKLTEKQREMLIRLEYTDTWDLTVDAASKVIDELVAEQGLNYGELREINNGYFNFPDDSGDNQQ